MSYFKLSVYIPILVNYPKQFKPHCITQSMSTLNLLPTIYNIIGTKPAPYLQIDSISMLPYLKDRKGYNTVFAEYTDKGAICLMIIIHRSP